MHFERPDGLPTGPSAPALNIGRWRDGLGLRWSFDHNSIKAVGRGGTYTIMRLAAFWIMTYFHGGLTKTEAIITRSSKDLEGAVQNVKSTERQVLFDDILNRALEKWGS
ncbi:MAG: hypothetical protein ACMUHY_08615 [Thermoplasmatota archaeon]